MVLLGCAEGSPGDRVRAVVSFSGRPASVPAPTVHVTCHLPRTDEPDAIREVADRRFEAVPVFDRGDLAG